MITTMTTTCDRCGEVNPADIHTCTPTAPSHEPVIGTKTWFDPTDGKVVTQHLHPSDVYAAQPAPVQEPMAITEQQAHDMGAKGAEPTEAERLLFEAWMLGHCWQVAGQWNGKTYVHEAEHSGGMLPSAMNTRQLWAAWRDRAALSTPPAAQRQPLTDEWIRSMCKETWAFETVKQWVRIAEAAHGIKGEA